MKRSGIRRRRQVIVGVVVLILCAAAGVWWVYAHHDRSASVKTVKTAKKVDSAAQKMAETNKQPTTIRLIATGDMLPHDSVNQNAKTANGYDYLPYFAQVQSYMTAGDMAYCNQESPSDPNKPVTGYPTFNAPVSFATDLSKVGCTVINLANNHADDKAQSGIDATRTVWDGIQTLAVAGTARSAAEQAKIATFTVKGVSFAFLSFAQCSNNSAVSSYGLNILSESLADAQIAAARAAKVDMIIAGMHACNENRSNEDAWQDRWAQYFADKGVDIVIGTGPHWLQPVKRLAKAGGGTTAVWFSLGNMLSTQLDIRGLIGCVALMDIDTASKTVTTLGCLPTYMHYEWSAADKATGNLSARHNLAIYPLDQATDPLARSQNNTTVPAQTDYVTKLLNTYTPVTIYTSKTFPLR